MNSQTQTQGVLPTLAALQDALGKLQIQVDAVLAELRSRPAPVAVDCPMAVSRTFFSVEEVAEMIGRSVYTTREHCRLGRLNAVKRAERRGSAALWSIPADEVARYKNEGLLPMNPDRNNRN